METLTDKVLVGHKNLCLFLSPVQTKLRLDAGHFSTESFHEDQSQSLTGLQSP